MQLSVRPAEYALPSFSLTGDLLGFLRCGLQYRYTRIGNLPSSRPVQMWFGRFIHGVLEEAYRQYATELEEGNNNPPPWPDARVEDICNVIKRRLAAENLFPWTVQLEKIGNERAKVAINQLGPHLFPLIHRAEVRLTGTRALPTVSIPSHLRFREADRYEMVGIVDVITHFELNDVALQSNPLLQLITAALPAQSPDQFEVIIDYKGMRRPSFNTGSSAGPSYWDIYAWQVQTYAHLRRVHEDSLPITAGVILYVNELQPTAGDLVRLKQEIASGATDVVPDSGSQAEKMLNNWRERDPLPDLPFEFRLRRAARVVTVTDQSVDQALAEFDQVVARIEVCRGQELQRSQVIPSWEKNATDENTCTACDARTFCPSYTQQNQPRLPAVRS